MIRLYRFFIAAFLGIYLSVFVVPASFEGQAALRSPKLANYFLKWELTDAEVQELAKWDLVILDMETQARSKDKIEKLRSLNPDIILLVYITSQEIRHDASYGWSIMRKKLAAVVPEQWYLKTSTGQRLSFWPGTDLLNVTNRCPLVNGQRFNQVLAKFVVDELLSTGLWDGVFYDNAWDSVTWTAGGDVDLNLDGSADSNVDAAWQAGMRSLYNETRRLSANRYMLVGNSGTKVYRDDLNGIMLENFPNSGGWRGTMDVYNHYEQGTRLPQAIVINRTSLNSGKRASYRSMRFGLTSALMGGGYYSFDHGDQDHGQLWYYDEYDANLGDPTGPSQSLANRPRYLEDVWRRDFSQGMALVNPTTETKQVDLGGEYEKLIGGQDPSINDGSIVDTVRLASIDGLLLLKTFKTVNNVFFKNGSFLRFYKNNGERARNGFFVFDQNYPGGAKIYIGDLDGNESPEKIIVNGPQVEIFNSRGERWANLFPMGRQYKGQLNVAVGRLLGSGEAQLVVSASTGGKVVLYNQHGNVLKSDVYPLGKSYTGGFSVAIGNVDGGKGGEVILGAGRARAGEIMIYDQDLKKIKKRFYPFGSTFRGTVVVTGGDFDGDGRDEVVAQATVGTRPTVRLFNAQGKKLNEFTVSGIFGSQALTLGAADVNFEGKKEIVVMSAN